MAVVDWHTQTDEASAAAIALAEHLQHGGELPQLDTSLPLHDGEALHAHVPAECWWHGAAETAYQKYRFLAFDNIAWLGLTAAASAIGNHRRRRTAAALAATQWRALGELPVLLTNQRLVLPIADTLWPIWLDDILHVGTSPDGRRIELVCDDQPPHALVGAWVPYIKVVLDLLLRR